MEDKEPERYYEWMLWKSRQEDEKEKFKHYLEKHKEHEANRTSTDDRNKYWNETV